MARAHTKLRNPACSWDDGFGEVRLRSNAQARITVLDKVPSGLPAHAPMRNVLQALRKTQEAFGQRVLETCGQARDQDTCRDGRCCGEEHGCANQAANERWRGRLSTSCWRRVAKTVTEPTSPTEVKVMFFVFHDD